MKKAIKYIFWSALFCTAAFYILLIFIFQIPSVQKEISSITSKYLGKQIGTKVNIGKIDFQFFDKLILKDVYLEDKSGDTFFAAKKIITGFDFFPLFKHRICINFAQIHTFTFNLKKESTDAPLNIQYIINALKKKNISISILNFSLKNGSFSYQEKDKGSTPGKFNHNDIHLNDIATTIQLHELSSKMLKANIKRLSFVEKSGLQIKQLALDLIIDDNNIRINRLDLNFPTSHLLLTKIVANCNRNHLENIFTDKTHFSFQIEPSQIHLKDICSFIPIFSNSKNQLEIRGKFTGKLNSFKLTRLTIKESSSMAINANVEIYHLNNPSRASIYANVKNAYIFPSEIQNIVSNFSTQAINFPISLVKRSEKVSFNGKIFGSLHKLNTNININTKVGYFQVNIQLGKKINGFLSGKISTCGFNAGKLIDSKNFNSVQLAIDFNSTFNNHWKDWKGNVEAVIKKLNYKSFYYKSICLSGNFNSNSFKGLLNVNSPYGQITANGFVFFKGKDSKFKFLANVSNMAFNKLYSTTRYKNLKLSFTVDANLAGNQVNNFNGKISFHKLKFSTDKSIYSMDSICIDVITNKKNIKQLLLHSDIINGKIDGMCSIKCLTRALQHFLTLYLPSLGTFEQSSFENEKNNFQLDLTINKTQKIPNFFTLPNITIYEQSHINGIYNNSQFSLNMCCPHLSIGNYTIENGILNLDNKKGYIDLHLNGLTSYKETDNKLSVSANFKAQDDFIYSIVEWSNNNRKQNSGRLNFVTNLTLQKTNSIVSIQLNSSELIINNSAWTVTPAKIIYNKNINKININHLIVKKNEQAIIIDGTMSKDKNDVLNIFLSEVNIDYIFKLLPIKIFDFGGIANGCIMIQDIFQNRQLSIDLNIYRFAFNNVTMGDLILHGRWDENKQGMEIKGKINNGTNDYINIKGFIYPLNEKISIFFDTHNTGIAFLNKYLDKILSNLSGQLTGRLHLFGDLNNPIIEGDALISNGMFEVKYLNTYYTFNNWIKCTSHKISIQNATFYDKYRNKAIVNASIKHDAFSNFQFITNLSCKNLLILNTTPNISPSFYGNVFATGTAVLSGNKELVSIEASLCNNKNTTLIFNFLNKDNVADYNFVNFLQKKHDMKEDSTFEILKKTDIRLNMMFNINSDATLEIAIDPMLDSKINSIGNGNFQIQYSTKKPLKIFGKYTIENGKYSFNFQKTFSRKFEIVESSSVYFLGNPFTANLDIKALYSMSANIRDLGIKNNQFLSIRNDIPINCAILISGQLKSPNIKFDLEFPGATIELKNKIKDLIYTNEMMNQQILFLLIMGRFNALSTSIKNEMLSANILSLLASSTLSSQVSSILKKISNKVQIKTRFHPYETKTRNNTEVELLLSSNLLNNHLIINSNFGYITNLSHLNSTNGNIPLIGDFDFEYKLTKDGDICIKGFNHYNYHSRSYIRPEATQSIGILFQKKF